MSQIVAARIGSFSYKYIKFDLSVDQTITITESFYPKFSPLSFITKMGSAIGLWLGAGVVQMIHFGWKTFSVISYKVSKIAKFK